MSNTELESNSTDKQADLEQQQQQQQQQPESIGEQANSLDQRQPLPSSSPSQVSNHNANPLNDHDYCSPNKGVPNKSKQLTSKINHNNSTTSRASTSTSPTKASNKKAILSTEPINNSASSSASSPCSSERSNGLVIAQEHETKVKLESQPTPQVKRRPGRPPVSGNKKKSINDGPTFQITTPKLKRERPARQSTSVTDKSQWIVGDDEIDSALSEHVDIKAEPQREKRQRIPKGLDSAFSQYTSSDYSSSDAESDEEEEEEEDEDSCDEDDPNRLWCICQKPHDGKFMICCDICKDWFHGQCVGVPKLMGDRFEREGKEWFCSDCQEKLKSGVPRAAIPEKIVKNEKKKKKKLIPGRRGRGRPRKSESSMREPSTRLSLRSARKSTSSLDPKMGVDNGRLKRNLSRTDARSESYDEFQDSQRLKELIRERKKAFFYKRQLAAEQKAAKRSELGLGSKQTITASLGDSLDSLATSTSSPNMSNLPINIKERPKPNIVLQINMKKDPTSDQNAHSRIVTTIVRSPKKTKHVDSTNPAVHDIFAADPIQINKKTIIKTTSSSVASNSTSSTSSNAASNQVSTSNGGDSGVRKRTSSTSSPSKKHKLGESADGSLPKKKRKDSESSLSNGLTTPGGSIHVVQRIKETLEGRGKEISDLKIGSDKIEKIATEIEGKLSENFKEGTHKYRTKYSSILFNLKDKKNLGLVKSVLTEVISPSKLVNMSSEELASSELAKWRERENKHSIELIKRDAQLAAQQVIVKKTHKGEEVISAPLINEPDDPSVTMDNQETPTTPNKLSTIPPKESPRVDSSKIILTPPVIKPPTIKTLDLDSLPSVEESERSPNHPNRSPAFDEYEHRQESSSHDADEISNMFDSTSEPAWSGLITMPDIEKFSVSAKPVCGLVNLRKDQISETLSVCGRIPPDQVQSYLKKLKSTTKHQVLMIQLFPLTDDDKPKFDTLFDYLYSRNRYGVIQTNPQLFKDFYIIPIHDKGSIPEALKPTVNGPGIDRKEANCLIGLLVKFIRRQSISSAATTGSTSESNAVYTP